MPNASISPAMLTATVEDLRRHAPFSEMDAEDVAWMAARLELAYYKSGDVILEPSNGVPDNFYVVRQGTVEAGDADQDSVIRLLAGECFPLGALLAKRTVVNQFRAVEDAFCYVLSASDFSTLIERSTVFRDFCTRRIASLLEQSLKQVHSHYALRQEEDARLDRVLNTTITREPVQVTQDTPLRVALQAMHEARVGSVAITDDNARPLGILTLKDVLSRVTLPGLSLETPVRSVMTINPVTLSHMATAREALLAMAQHGIHHLLLEKEGRLFGVASEKDLFAIKRTSVQSITSSIAVATRVQELQRIAPDIAALAHSLLAQGVEAETLTELIATLNDHLTRRLIELELQQQQLSEDMQGVRWCWLALGSEGRKEQTLATDQDNALIFEAQHVEQVRAVLLTHLKHINQALDACGFPLCKGGIMASNPKWCLSLDEWKHQFGHWIESGGPEELLNASIFFDFRPLHGELTLAHDLQSWLHEKAKANPRFLKQMAQNALRNAPPLGLVRDFVLSDDAVHPHTLDLKLNGAMPFVDAARIYALAGGQPATGTSARLREAGAVLGIPAGEIAAWVQAFQFIQLIRLRHQHEQERRGQLPDNYLDPDSLSVLDRRILKEAFRQARKLQARLALDYQR